jgi:hypothetical protein
VRGSAQNWSFFDVPALSRASQSLGVWSGKIINGWPLILRSSFALLGRFVFGRMRPAK